MLVGEAVQARGHRPVVFGKRAGAQSQCEVHPRCEARVALGLLADLVPHRAEEARRVDTPAETAVEDARARHEVERRRDGDRADQLLRRVELALAEPLEQDVAPERDADDAERRVGVALEQQPDHVVEVVGVPGVVELR